MGIEGLKYILEKKEVIPTVSASDLLDNAERVEQDYLRHVRTYVPISRAGQGEDGKLSVRDFERKVINAVKEDRALRGYLTAEYGYGKTSTALYLWKRAEESNLVTVPPFQMLHLIDLIKATYGWVKYRLSQKRPDLLEALDTVYKEITQRGLEQGSQHYNIPVAKLEQMRREGSLILDVQPTDYVHYFEKVTQLVLEAKFDGLLILPDEIQQYIEPRQRTSETPLQPLFNLIQAINTREGRLKFGVIFIVGLKEVGYMRDVRNDLLHRLRTYSIDLTNVYDSEFAPRLWQQLASEFEFKDVSDAVVDPSTLLALGEIATRTDLSDGPRTVINTFKRMVQRFGAITDAPYTPIDLIDDFISGAVQFSGNDQITRITRKVLQSGIVQNNPHVYEPAVKLAAAFPMNGVPYSIQQRYGVEKALGDLMQLAIGELVISIGSPEDRGMTLFGLHEGVKQTDWTTQTVREFRRHYGEIQAESVRRAKKFFEGIVEEVLFKGWKLVDSAEANLTRNRSLTFEGHFPAFASRFPNRKVQVRILWEQEELKDGAVNGDIALNFCLSTHSDKSTLERNRINDPIQVVEDEHTAFIPINLMYFSVEAINVQISKSLENVWSPYELSPYVLMNITEMLLEKDPPERDKMAIKNQFLPEVRRDVVRFLFNETMGNSIGAGKHEYIIQYLVEELLKSRYGETYHTLTAQTQWKNDLLKYKTALKGLDNPFQKRGEIEVEGTKDQLAQRFALKNTTFDNFRDRYPKLISITQEWSQKSPNGAIKFNLHNLEERILQWLRTSKSTKSATTSRGQSETIHTIDLGEVFRKAKELGYQDDEIQEIISVMEARELVTVYANYALHEVPTQTADLDTFARHLSDIEQSAAILMRGLSDNQQLQSLNEELDKLKMHLSKERQKPAPDPQQVNKLTNHLKRQSETLNNFFGDQKTQLIKDIERLSRLRKAVRDQDVRLLQQEIQGSVNYVAQVNFLGTLLRTSANKIKSEADQLSHSIDSIDTKSREPSLSYEGFISLIEQLHKIEKDQNRIHQDIQELEERLENFKGWQSLVRLGSDLLREIQIMGDMAHEQSYRFDQLSSDIRSDISTKSQQERLTVLPNHPTYATQINEIRQTVDGMRSAATSKFNDMQQTYFSLLTKGNLFKRDQIGSTISFNISDPADSERLLFDHVGKLTHTLYEKLYEIYLVQRDNAKAILQKPLLNDLPDDEREEINSEAQTILNLVEQQLRSLNEISPYVQNITVIRDITKNDDSGQFNQLIDHLRKIRDPYRDIHERNDNLTQKLQRSQLSEDEELVLGYLADDNPNAEVELTTWITGSNVPSEHMDQFWGVVRSLYDKHRIRIKVGRVRK